MRDQHAPPDEAVVAAALGGDREAFAALFERWFDRVHDVARNIVRDPETAADVAQDTFIVVWERLDQLERPEAFGGWVLRIARNRALNRLERDQRSRPHEVDVVTGLHDHGLHDPTASSRELEPEEISATHDRDGLVQAAAVALGERDASILDLHLRHGLTPAEIAEELGVTANNAHQLLFRLRARLGDAIGAFVLWHRGRPACGGLAAAVAGATGFDADTLTLVERHRRGCDECTDRRAQLLAPEQLFSAAPIVAVAVALRERVRAGLVDAGVPAPGAGADASPNSTPPRASQEGADGKQPARDDSAAHVPSNDAAQAGTDPASDRVPDGNDPGHADRVGSLPAPGSGLEPGPPEAAADADVGGELSIDSRRRRIAAALVGLALVLLVVGVAIVVIARSGDTVDLTVDPAAAEMAAGADDTDVASPGSLPDATAPPSGLGADDTGDDERRSTNTSAPDEFVSPTVAAEAPPATTADAGLAPATTQPPPGGVAPNTTAPGAPPSAPSTDPIVAQPPPSPTTAPAPEATTTTTTLPPTTTTSTTLSPTTTTTTTQPPAVPKITGFSVIGGPPLLCAIANQSPRTFQWSSVNATAGTLVVHGVARSVAATGSIDVCAASGSAANLTVTGPGGSDSQVLVVP